MLYLRLRGNEGRLGRRVPRRPPQRSPPPPPDTHAPFLFCSGNVRSYRVATAVCRRSYTFLSSRISCIDRSAAYVTFVKSTTSDATKSSGSTSLPSRANRGGWLRLICTVGGRLTNEREPGRGRGNKDHRTIAKTPFLPAFSVLTWVTSSAAARHRRRCLRSASFASLSLNPPYGVTSTIKTIADDVKPPRKFNGYEPAFQTNRSIIGDLLQIEPPIHILRIVW